MEAIPTRAHVAAGWGCRVNTHPVANVSTTHVCSVPDCGAPLRVEVPRCRKPWRLVAYDARPKVWGAWGEWRCGQLSAPDLRAVGDRATRADRAGWQARKGVATLRGRRWSRG